MGRTHREPGMTISTYPQLLSSIASALDQGDISALDTIEAVVDGWMQPQSEREAQKALIASVRASIEREA